MTTEAQLNYYCRPGSAHMREPEVEFRPVQDFIADEPSCRELWDLLVSQFKTRGKFLAIWPCVRFVAQHRDADGRADGFLLVSTPVNWQIDYVVVHERSRGRGIAQALVRHTLYEARLRHVPYVMLTSKASLRPLYESCGFTVVGSE